MLTRTFTILIFLGLTCCRLMGYEDMTAEQFLGLIQDRDSVVVLDVRETDEFDGGHIEGAHLYPFFSEVFHEKWIEIPAGYPLAVYCGSGFRSGQASAILDTADGGIYEGNVYNLTSGLGSWPYSTVTGGQDGPALEAGTDSLGLYIEGQSEDTTGWFTLRNTSSQGAAIVLISLEEEGSAFSVSPETATVLPGDSLSVEVTFTPSGTGTAEDMLGIVHGGFDRHTLEVRLSGGKASVLARGDLDSSGKTDIFDLLELLKALSGKDTGIPMERLDLEPDGVVNIFDLLEMLRILGGKA